MKIKTEFLESNSKFMEKVLSFMMLMLAVAMVPIVGFLFALVIRYSLGN